MNYQLFILIFIIQFILASMDFFKNCQKKNLYNYLILFLHHLLDVYVFFGIFLTENKNEKLLHLLTIVLILIHWFSNNYECWLTTYLNDLCLEPRNKWLYSLAFITHKISGLYYLHSYWIILVIIKNLYLLID
jgi:hypothetical protein